MGPHFTCLSLESTEGYVFLVMEVGSLQHGLLENY